MVIGQNRFDSLFNSANNDFGSIIDTVKVKALVSYDYSYSDKFDELKVEPVFITYLMQVRKHYYPYHTDYVIINEKRKIEIIGYLGEHGEKLSRIINVWQTKIINK